MNSLAYTPPKPEKTEGATPVTIVDSQDAEQKPQYPSLRLNGEQAKEAKLDKCAYGDEYEITVRIRATRIGGSEWEMKKDGLPPVEFDVIEANDPKEVENTEGETEDDKERRKPIGERKNIGGKVLSPKEAGMEEEE